MNNKIIFILLIISLIGNCILAFLLMNEKRSGYVVTEPDGSSITIPSDQVPEIFIEDLPAPEGVSVGDEILMSDAYLVENISNSETLTILAQAMEQSDIFIDLQSGESYTVFAPTTSAFDQMDQASLKTLLETENEQALREVLNYHIIQGDYSSTDLISANTLKTLQGKNLTFSQRNGILYINNDVPVEIQDITSSNGTIHMISQVLQP